MTHESPLRAGIRPQQAPAFCSQKLSNCSGAEPAAGGVSVVPPSPVDGVVVPVPVPVPPVVPLVDGVVVPPVVPVPVEPVPVVPVPEVPLSELSSLVSLLLESSVVELLSAASRCRRSRCRCRSGR